MQVEPGHRFEVVIEHVGAGRDHGFERAVLAQEVRGQDLDRRFWRRRADCTDGLGEMPGAAVAEVVAIDGRHDDMLKLQMRDGLCNAPRLVGVEVRRQARRDVAERAGARANAAHDHHRRVPLLPAVADVRAGGLFADGVKLVFADDGPRVVITG